jgi:hypothetical protein
LQNHDDDAIDFFLFGPPPSTTPSVDNFTFFYPVQFANGLVARKPANQRASEAFSQFADLDLPKGEPS